MTSGFTEDEYKRELELQHVTIPSGKNNNPSDIYKKLPQDIKDTPRSGVFRDFVEYGVYPVRVVVQYAVVTIPFFLESLTVEQLYDELEEQDGIYEEDKTPLENAYELIQTYNKRKRFKPSIGAMKRYLSGLNLYLFKFGSFDEVCTIPRARKDLAILAALIPENLLIKELDRQFEADPDNWQKDISELRDASKEYEILLIESMTNKVLTSNLRGIIEWFKKAYRREQLYKLLRRVTQDYKSLIPTVKIKSLS